MPAPIIGGILALKIDGVVYSAVGNFTYNQGLPLRADLLGATSVDGYTETPQAAFIAGEIRDSTDVDLEKLATATDVTASLELRNGKTFVLANAWYAGEATGNSEQANFPLRLVSNQQGTFI